VERQSEMGATRRKVQTREIILNFEDYCLQGAVVMEAASTSETSVTFYQITRRNNPEDSHLHTRRRENLKSHNTQF
jgi:hypothetical protein